MNQLLDSDCPLRFPKAGLCASFAWIREPDPMSAERAKMSLVFFKPGTKPRGEGLVNPKHRVGVKLWMPSMSHGSDPVRVVRLASGKYEAREIYFSMAGAWEIQFQLLSGETVVEQVAVDYVAQ